MVTQGPAPPEDFDAARRLFMRAEYDEREGRVRPSDLEARLMDLAPVTGAVHALLDVPSLRPGARVLDVGTGAGTFALAVARATPRVTVIGTDLAPRAVAAARAAAEALSLRNARFTVADFEVDALPEADAVVMAYALSLAEDPARVLRNVGRALAPGGRLVVFDAHLPPRVEPTALTPRRLAACAEEAGFTPAGHVDVTALVRGIVARGAWPWSRAPDAALRFAVAGFRRA